MHMAALSATSDHSTKLGAWGICVFNPEDGADGSHVISGVSEYGDETKDAVDAILFLKDHVISNLPPDISTLVNDLEVVAVDDAIDEDELGRLGSAGTHTVEHANEDFLPITYAQRSASDAMRQHLERRGTSIEEAGLAAHHAERVEHLTDRIEELEALSDDPVQRMIDELDAVSPDMGDMSLETPDEPPYGISFA